MAALWLVHLRIRNAGVVDVGWAFAVGGLGVFYAYSGQGWLGRRFAIASMFLFWSARLGLFLLADRVVGREEEGRYRTLRQRWGARAQAHFFWFFQAQALAALFFSLPILLASAGPVDHLLPVELVGLTLWLVGFGGETLADQQLERFKANRDNKGQTCRAGLWHYSRHPNYFFEWLMWVAYAFMALGSPWGALALLCPVAMLYLLFRVTGIPATEAQAVQSRGDDYRRYQRTTSAFFPWFPR
jgi:steroid 5-alpha reductase family enzyme